MPPGKETQAKRLVIMNRLARELYEKEDEATKQKVEGLIESTQQEYVSSIDSILNGERTPEQYVE